MTRKIIAPRIDKSDVISAASGQWPEILAALAGADPEHLDGAGHPCPICQDGDDRFGISNKQGEFEATGSCFCRICGLGGDGFNFISKATGWDFQRCLDEVAAFLGVGPAISGQPPAIKPAPAKKKPPKKAKPLRTYDTFKDAKKAVSRSARSWIEQRKNKDGSPKSVKHLETDDYVYRNRDGSVFCYILRFSWVDIVEKKHDKTFRPITPTQDGRWADGGLKDVEHRPLYRLPEISDAATVYVAEGEKSVDALLSMGLDATTSSSGSSSARMTDWSPLDGKRVIINPDHDSSGEKYVGSVSKLIREQAPLATLEVANLFECWPDIEEKGDAHDWSEAHDSWFPEDFQAELERIARPVEIEEEEPEAVEHQGGSGDDTVTQRFLGAFHPMPVHVLPEVVREFVLQVSRAVGCDESFVALPALTVAASLIGTTRRLLVKKGWFVPSILWSVVVGESGTQKSPPLRAVSAPLKARQRKQIEDHTKAIAAYKAELLVYKNELRKSGKDDSLSVPDEPLMPTCERCLVSDTTIEGLVPILQENPRGLVLLRDELAGWFGGFDKYSKSGNSSADAAHWLSVYNADSLIVDRKTGEPRTLFVADPAVSVCGTIQPTILDRALSGEHRENGLAARLLMTYPPRRQKQWTDAEIPQEQSEAWADVVDSLAGLQHDMDSDGKHKAGIVFLSSEAREQYVEYYNRTAQELAGLSGEMAATWSKLEEMPARLALVIHCIRQVAGEPVDPWECDGHSMKSAIELAEWSKDEAQRIHSLLSEDAGTRACRQLAEWVQLRGGCVKERDLINNRRDVANATDSENALQSLVQAGFGNWQLVKASPKGGRPTRQFVLNQAD